jgi:hypothetical protein
MSMLSMMALVLLCRDDFDFYDGLDDSNLHDVRDVHDWVEMAR